MSKVINITPTWQAILPALVALLENKETRKDAMMELDRMAQVADAYVSSQKTNP